MTKKLKVNELLKQKKLIWRVSEKKIQEHGDIN